MGEIVPVVCVYLFVSHFGRGGVRDRRKPDGRNLSPPTQKPLVLTRIQIWERERERHSHRNLERSFERDNERLRERELQAEE